MFKRITPAKPRPMPFWVNSKTKKHTQDSSRVQHRWSICKNTQTETAYIHRHTLHHALFKHPLQHADRVVVAEHDHETPIVLHRGRLFGVFLEYNNKVVQQPSIIVPAQVHTDMNHIMCVCGWGGEERKENVLQHPSKSRAIL